MRARVSFELVIPDHDDFTDYSATDLCIDPSSIGCGYLGEDAAPLRRLWVMVLTVAVVDYLVAKPSSKRFLSAKEWIFYNGAWLANSFDNVALLLEFDPQRLRNAIACRRSEVWADSGPPLKVLAALRELAVETAKNPVEP